jgi:hypothetical protein
MHGLRATTQAYWGELWGNMCMGLEQLHWGTMNYCGKTSFSFELKLAGLTLVCVLISFKTLCCTLSIQKSNFKQNCLEFPLMKGFFG